MNDDKKQPLHYGWVIVFVGFVIMCFVVCIVQNCAGLFVKPVSESLGITRRAFSLSTTCFSIAGILLASFMGKIYAKFTIKRVMIVASIIMPIAYGSYSIAPNIYVIYAISFVCGLMSTSMTMIAISTLMANWFNEKRGLAIALASTGSGVGGIFLNPIIGHLITTFGWRRTYAILAVVMAVTVIPCTLFLVKDTPAQKGLSPYGGVTKSGEVKQQFQGLTADQARKSPVFWIWAPVCAVVAAGCTCAMQHTVAYVTDIGYDYSFAAGIASGMTASLAIGKIIMGGIFDKMGSRKGATISLSLFMLSFLLYGFAENKAVLIAAVAILGFGLSFATVAFSVVTQDLFGKKDYAGIYGMVTMCSSIGSAMGSPTVASVFDNLGSYKPAWAVLAALMGVAVILVNCAFAYNSKRKQR